MSVMQINIFSFFLTLVYRVCLLQSYLLTSPPTTQSHIQSFGSPGQLLKIATLTHKIYDSAGGKEGMFMPNEVFKNDSNDFISNIKETVDVTLATDYDRQLEAHNYSFTNQ
jgi:hypothetical protein